MSPHVYGIDAALVMYVATGVLMIGSITLIGFAVAGADTIPTRLARLVAVVTFVSAWLALVMALAVIFG